MAVACASSAKNWPRRPSKATCRPSLKSATVWMERLCRQLSAESHREFAMASGEMSEAEFRSFLTDTLGAAARVSRDGAVHIAVVLVRR